VENADAADCFDGSICGVGELERGNSCAVDGDFEATMDGLPSTGLRHMKNLPE
jgi:hypothetical protein